MDQSTARTDYENPAMKQGPAPAPGPRPQTRYNMNMSSTLNESVLQSLFRDISQIFIRIRYVVFPFGSGTRRLKNWDLWGPLVLCIGLAWTLSSTATSADANAIFGTVFCLIWVGSAVVTINGQVLGGSISIFHSVCTLGYSLFPMNVAAIICVFLKDKIDFTLALIITTVAFLWSFKSASVYMEEMMGPNKKGLAIYPIFLFYIFLAFFILQITEGS